MKRIIARLDIKNNTVIKGVHLEGLRKVGEPITFAERYYEGGIHEIFLNDTVASLYDRNNLFDILDKTCRRVFVPICIGGGIRSIDDVSKALQAGADKVAINTAIIKNPQLINIIAQKYGSQCLVGSIEAKKLGNSWLCYYDCGRESSGMDVLEWASEMESRGIGEILLTSIDKEGTKKGFDLDLLNTVCSKVRTPIIASGGCGSVEHAKRAWEIEGVEAVAVASTLHYGICQVSDFTRDLA